MMRRRPKKGEEEEPDRPQRDEPAVEAEHAPALPAADIQRLHAALGNAGVGRRRAAQREASAEGLTHVAPRIQARSSAESGKGELLESLTRAEMEAKLGGDFSSVRIHQGPVATELSEQLDAVAF